MLPLFLACIILAAKLTMWLAPASAGGRMTLGSIALFFVLISTLIAILWVMVKFALYFAIALHSGAASALEEAARESSTDWVSRSTHHVATSAVALASRLGKKS
jgi:hypothetical protein